MPGSLAVVSVALQQKSGRSQVKTRALATKNHAELLTNADNETVLPDLNMAAMLRCRIRYFTDGAVIGSREFVNEAFVAARERFGAKRKDGARKFKGRASAAGRALWSMRDLQKGFPESLVSCVY